MQRGATTASAPGEQKGYSTTYISNIQYSTSSLSIYVYIGVTEKRNVTEWLEPVLVDSLQGEECVVVAVGASHCLAGGASGDCFVWGNNDAGQLGVGSFDNSSTVAINHSFPAVETVACGANHSVALTRSGQLYTWGHALNGRLGNGTIQRILSDTGVGVNSPQYRQYFPVPYVVSNLERIEMVSCGADHSLAVGASGVWSWGCGSGGKLGHGDNKDR